MSWLEYAHAHTHKQSTPSGQISCTRIHYSITCLHKNGRVPSWRCVCDPACFNKRLKWLIPFWLAGGQIMFSQSLHDKILQDNHFFLAVMLMDEAWLRCANWQCSVSLTESKRMEWKLPQNQCLPEKTFKPFVWRWNNNKFKKYASACLLTCR